MPCLTRAARFAEKRELLVWLDTMASVAELTIGDSRTKVCVFQPDGNKPVESRAWNYLVFSVDPQIQY